MSCSSKQRQLCGKEECIICFDRSFASFQGKTPNGKLKVDCWDNEKNGEIKPINIRKGSNKKYCFKCDICVHNFEVSIDNISLKNTWCSYCAHQKLCGNKYCNFCYNNSFASYIGQNLENIKIVDCWDNKKNGELKPRDVFKKTAKKYWFKCANCKISKLYTINFITNGGNSCDICSYNNYKLSNKGSWYNNYENFKKFIESLGYNLITSKKEWINDLQIISSKECRKSPANKYKPIVECNKGHTINNTTVNSFISSKTCCYKCSKNGYSKKQIQWLDFISILHDITIQHAINNKEHKIKNIGKVDGYCKENNTIYEFHGDLWHGNPMKFNILDKNSINLVTKKTYYELYENTLKRDKKIKELGYNLVIMWENQWDKINNSIKLLQNKWRDYKNKPHKCEKCNISFKFKSQLEKHCKTDFHKTGKKKTRSDKKEEFKCEICNLYTTNQQTNLKLHILNNHKTKEERKNEFHYYCEICDSGFMEEKL